MVELQQEPGILIFAALTAFMVLSAGVASFTPARDIRVFLGAAIQSGGWVLLLAAQKQTSDFAITSSLFIADIFYLIAFYYLSKATKKDAPGAVFQRNWAGYIVMVFTIMISIEMVHFVDKNDYFLEPFVRVFLYAAGIILLFGFLRGFGILPSIGFCLYIIAMVFIGNNQYVNSSNFLSLMVILIITFQALRGVKKNLRHWFNIQVS